jgi:hypothetical protein
MSWVYPHCPAFEKLHRTLVLFGFFARGECAQVSALSRFRVYLSRIQAVLAGLEFANHFASPPLMLACDNTH